MTAEECKIMAADIRAKADEFTQLLQKATVAGLRIDLAITSVGTITRININMDSVLSVTSITKVEDF